ncbi:dienelactone hydrolase family protein [Hydrogenophaga atypica]|uniref:Dienelactone hydrolase family protein n=1 Tax=Hydrogenophaga atypica TaxID=249409 RepID=A0ABW2QGR4_9BURK
MNQPLLRAVLGSIAAIVCNTATAEPLDNLTNGQTGRIEFNASNPAHRWNLIRGKLGEPQVIFGDLFFPPGSTLERFPAVVMSHGSDGITNGMHEIWAKPLLAAGYAVFMIDSFTPRGSDKIGGTSGQLTWNTTFNISDSIYALRLLTTHPKIDAARIYHLGWSRGGNAVTGAMWPNYRYPITQSEDIRWAGSVAVYPGCNLRYQNPKLKLTAPVLYLLAEKDDMTPAQPCVEEADLLAAAGNPVRYRVYSGAYHGFDRPNQSWRQIRQGTYARCAIDVVMPENAKDYSWGPSFHREKKESLETPEKWREAVKACESYQWVTSETHRSARDEAVKETLSFFAASRAMPLRPDVPNRAGKMTAEEILQKLNWK